MKLLPSVEPRWLLHVIGILFVGAGCIVFVMGCRTYHIVIKKLEKEGFRGIPSALMGVLTSALFPGTILGLVLIIMDRFEAISKVLIVRSPIHSYVDRHKWHIPPVAQIVNSDGILWRLLEYAAFFPENNP